MTLHRFFLPLDAFTEQSVRFTPEQSHQLRRVLRLVPGDRVTVLDGTGYEADVALTTLHPQAEGALGPRRHCAAEPNTEVVLYQAMLKPAKMELIFQRCTEIGVTRFAPLISSRSQHVEPSESKMGRFRTILREAAEQSRRGRIPELDLPRPFAAVLAESVLAGPAYLLWEEEARDRLRIRDSSHAATTISLFVGPEGGFSREEVDAARHTGITVITLGKRILRAETAALVASTLTLAQAGELG